MTGWHFTEHTGEPFGREGESRHISVRNPAAAYHVKHLIIMVMTNVPTLLELQWTAKKHFYSFPASIPPVIIINTKKPFVAISIINCHVYSQSQQHA